MQSLSFRSLASYLWADACKLWALGKEESPLALKMRLPCLPPKAMCGCDEQ